MAKELHSDTLEIEQRGDSNVVTGEKIGNAAYFDELAFMEEPVTIRLEPSSDKNAAMAFPVWVNGKKAEVYQNGRWDEIGYLPVGRTLVVRRSVLEVIIRAKIDTVHTRIENMDSERPNNREDRFTSPIHSFSIIEDRNPRGAAWVTEIRRRNL
jgi:hypothetical protein